jgi:hypothetical protein
MRLIEAGVILSTIAAGVIADAIRDRTARSDRVLFVVSGPFPTAGSTLPLHPGPVR